jgi:ferredoxin
MSAIVNAEECIGCGLCLDSCPEEAIGMEDDVAVVDQGACNDCGTCVDECPTEAIMLSVKESA